ncbi:MAG: DUF3078 domain-containing protein [Chitinophagales bacterium]
MKKMLLLLLLCIVSSWNVSVLAQEKVEEVEDDGWKRGLSFGMDFAQLLQINPKVGAGEDKLGIGGTVGVFGNYKKDKLLWNNTVSLLFGIQRLGSGLSVINPTIDNPFQKSIDELRFSSKIGTQVKDDSKWAYAAELTFVSQITPTYPGNFLTDVTDTGASPIAKLFSPATLTLSPGIDYKANKKLSFFFAPFSWKAIFVLEDAIAALPASTKEDNTKGIHGNDWRSPTDFDNTFHQLGATLKGIYQDKFLEGKGAFKSELTLFSNYLENPQNLDVDWRNEIAMNIWKGLQLSLTVNVVYDHDVKVQITDYSASGGVQQTENGPALGRRASITEQLLIKYNVVF